MAADKQEQRQDLAGLFFRDALLVGVTATHLYLIRHAESKSNTGDDHMGADAELTEAGGEQARLLAERLAREGIDALYASHLRRAQQTAEAISRATGLEVMTQTDLQEIAFRAARGGAPGLSRSRLGALARRIAREGSWDAIPGSEGSQAFRRRVGAVMERISEGHPGQRVAVVTHGGFIQAYVCLTLGLAQDFVFYPFNASITSIRAKEERRVLWRLNDIAHLDGLAPGRGGIS